MFGWGGRRRRGRGEGEGEGESEEEEATAERSEDGEDGGARDRSRTGPGNGTPRRRRCSSRRKCGSRDASVTGNICGAPVGRGGEGERDETRDDVFTVEMARELGKIEGRSANPDAVSQFFASHMRDDYIKFSRKNWRQKRRRGKEARLVAQQAARAALREADKEKPTKSHRARR